MTARRGEADCHAPLAPLVVSTAQQELGLVLQGSHLGCERLAWAAYAELAAARRTLTPPCNVQAADI